MAGKYVKLTAEQKEEIRRLTQLANRRIKTAHKQYAKEGLESVPMAIVGKYQIKEQWESNNYALSRSVKFTSEKEYKDRLRFLRSFDPKHYSETKPTVSQFKEIEHGKTVKAIETVLGTRVPPKLAQKLAKMNAPQLSKFWNAFDDRAKKVGPKYSSNAVMAETLQEFFDEDMDNFTEKVDKDLEEQEMIANFIKDMQGKKG